MKIELLDFLSCPECENSLEIRILEEENFQETTEIKEGYLICKNSHFYVVTNYIPRMLPNQLEKLKNFKEKYSEIIPAQELKFKKSNLEKLQEKTIESFGFEWKKWNRFGWENRESLEKTKAIFDYKVMFKPEEIRGKLLLDAGCGNGRYTKIASDYGAISVGVDLSEAVDEAFKNLGVYKNIHFVQGDLFKLPFKKNLFDFIFSNGVLMHTGNAKKAFISLTRHLNEDGVISIHLYHKGNLIYEFNDWWLRSITTRLPLNATYIVSKILAGIARALPKKLVMYGLNSIFRIEPHEHYVFDWYTAPIATHHTYKEVYEWLKEAGLHLVADHNKTNYKFRKYLFPFQFLTIKAGKKHVPGEKVLHTTS